jgi:endonuclease YncB( thermonuclease family)
MFRRSMKCIFFLLIFLGSQIIRVYGWQIDQTSSVTGVEDGDTFYIPNDKVRLADIQAPEVGNEPGYSIAKYALSSMVGGKTVYLDTDQKSGRDPYNRLIAVVYVKYNSTHYLNVNKALLVQEVAVEMDFTNNEFSPASWTLYVRYANASSQIIIGPRGPQGIQGPPGEPAPINLLYLALGASVLSLIIAIVTIITQKLTPR